MPRSADRIELAWLVTVRWTTLAACVGAIVFGQTALGIDTPLVVITIALLISAATNVRLHQLARTATALPPRAPGILVCSDVVLLAGCLAKSGGVLNPASIFFLVEIVLAALVLGRPWTWIVTLFSVAGYGLQLLAPTSELAAAATMHPQIGEHVRGMWWAFIATAVIIGALVTRLALAIERRDRALALLREDAERQTRLMSLASMAAGAAHELSTPLGTIAVAAGELSRAAATLPGASALGADIDLIRSELVRARRILTDLSGRAESGANALETTTVGDVLSRALAGHPPEMRARVAISGDVAATASWPLTRVVRALDNVITNALQSSADGAVTIVVAAIDSSRVRITIVDTGAGMDDDTLAHAGEPFFTTRPDGVGLGLGLYVSRATAQQLGGTLAIISHPKQGTTVTIELPTQVLV